MVYTHGHIDVKVILLIVCLLKNIQKNIDRSGLSLIMSKRWPVSMR